LEVTVAVAWHAPTLGFVVGGKVVPGFVVGGKVEPGFVVGGSVVVGFVVGGNVVPGFVVGGRVVGGRVVAGRVVVGVLPPLHDTVGCAVLPIGVSALNQLTSRVSPVGIPRCAPSVGRTVAVAPVAVRFAPVPLKV
jgi:hypothetical protein